MHPTMTTSNGTSHLDEPSKDKEKIVLPVEMASMVPLRTLIAKLVHKSYADLLTLTDTLPSMSDVEKKRRILTYSLSVRKQFLKLLVLIKWAENAEDIQMCQNIMAFLANQNKIFQDTVDYLHNIHSKLPAARLRNFDIPTAVDVLTTGTYQRMPTKIKDMMAPVPLSDQEVLETFQNMNDVIRMRMITTEVLPSPMQTYRIENGRIYFTIQNEFEVALTLMGHSHDRRWWIVSLDMLVQATSTGGAAEDVDITLNETQKQHLRVNAQKQLVPPPSMESNSLFFPLVNMYDYLHLCCLNMQLEVLYIQAAMLAKTRWINQLKVQMNPDRTKLTLIYWRGGSHASRWASRSNSDKSTTIEISVNDQEDPEEDYQMAVRDDWHGVIQKAGIGASIHLSELPVQDRSRVLSLLKYPKTTLSVLWDGYELKDHGLDPSDLNLERLVLQTTHDHGACMIDKFRSLLLSQRAFLEENGLFLDTTSTSQLVVRYRHAKYISIDTDTRTGRIKAFEADDGCHEGDFKLRGLEDRLNNDPENIARHLLWLRSEVVVREVIALAKQLNLQPYHPSQMNLRPEDIQKLFGDLVPDGVKEVSYPSHCVFLQFSQFEDWYFCMATVKNQFKSWLCCINKTYDATGLYQTIVDLAHLNSDQLWSGQFKQTSPTMERETLKREIKEEDEKEEGVLPGLKKRRTSRFLLPTKERDEEEDGGEPIKKEEDEKVDRLSIDLRYLAKLDSLCQAYIINRKIESQLQSYKGSLKYHTRPLLKTINRMETQVRNHPAAEKMEVICVSQSDVLKTCAYHAFDDQAANLKKERTVEPNRWVEQLVPHMKNDILIRSFGWWDCGQGDCYVVIQDRLDHQAIKLKSHELSDHIALDKATGALSFTYAQIDHCIEQFLIDWERVLMMANLARQTSSVWFKKYQDQLEFEPTDLQTLTFTYAKHYVCTVRWDSGGKGQPRRYQLDLKTDQVKSSSILSLPSKTQPRNPHWRIANFLRDILNEKRDLIWFIQILFQTLDLMQCLEQLEANCIEQGDLGKVSIIPRAYDTVRVIFSSMHALDIRFTDKSTLCISDAAYYHLFYTSHSNSSLLPLLPPPVPYHLPPLPSHSHPIPVAQQLKFVPFDQFAQLLETIESWIFQGIQQHEQELDVVPFQHGVLCSSRLCHRVLEQILTCK